MVQFDERRPYLRGLVCWIGFNQVIVQYHRQARFSGESHFNVLSWHVVNHFLNSALISFSDAPLRLSALLGIVVSATGSSSARHERAAATAGKVGRDSAAARRRV